MRWIRAFGPLAAVLAATAWAGVGCGDDEVAADGSADATEDPGAGVDRVESGEAREYYGSTRPGDIVTVTVDGDSITLTNETVGWEVVATVAGTVAGFSRLVWDDDEGGEQSGSFVEIPGQGIMALGAYEDPLVVGTIRGGCPDTATAYNYLWVPDCEWVPDTDSVFAVLEFTPNAGAFTVHATLYTLAGDEESQFELEGATCADGVFTIPDSEITFGVTPAGFLIGDHGPGEGVGAGFPVPAEAPTTGDVAGVALYRGYVNKVIPDTEEGADGPVATIPVEAESGGGTLNGFAVDVEGDGGREGPYPFTFDPDRFSELPGVLGGSFIGRDFLFLTGEVGDRRFVYGLTFEVASISFEPDAEEGGFYVEPGQTVCECLANEDACDPERYDRENGSYPDNPRHVDDDGETAIPGYNLSALTMYLAEQ